MNKKSIIEEMKSYYDQRAPWHDEYMSYNGIEKMEELFLPIINIIEPTIHKQTVLEIACGTGNWTQVIAKRAQSVIALEARSLLRLHKRNSANLRTSCIFVLMHMPLKICHMIAALFLL